METPGIPTTSSNPSGRILHMQRLSTEDGPGIRTTVFFKGCPLHCRWCHNPESISPGPQVQWLENRCIGCGSCLEACPQEALQQASNGIRRDRNRCLVCGACVEACPAGAHELLGVTRDADSLVQELLKDRAFFEKSGGGVTLSGGEPTRQLEFAAALAGRLHAAGISVALDTCGLCLWESLERLLPFVDLILFDLKLVDPVLHRIWTGASNRLILENFLRLCQMLPERYPQFALWIRTPLVPIATLTQENIQAIGELIAGSLQTTDPSHIGNKHEGGSDMASFRWELCAFNNLCKDKYRRLDLDWEFNRTPLLTTGELNKAGRWAEASGLDPQRIFVTGTAASS